MAPLPGLTLIDCAKANSKQGLEVAAQYCGYGEDTETFIETLQAACREIGVDIQELSDLISERQRMNKIPGVTIAPDSPSDLGTVRRPS
ncbi:MAG: hypothetical protein WA902_05750 [Thermosynechococcaceae cyanobacterium]